MSLQIINNFRRRQHEDAVAAYMREIREIQGAGFDRRELLKLGLVAGSSGLAALAAAPSFRPHWAHAAALTLVSPPNTPFIDPLPIPHVLTPKQLDPLPTMGPNPALSGYNGFYECARPAHQQWTQGLGGISTQAAGFAGKMYESCVSEVMHSFYPAQNGVPASPIWTFTEAGVPTGAPVRIKAKYGEPIIHRIHNELPAENHGFGINQCSTHLHNGHTPWESDGGPLQFYDYGHFRDMFYPNARAGFRSSHPETTWNGPQGLRTVQGDYRETMSSLWFHDHRFDFTAQNVYKGMVGFYSLFSDDLGLDTDDETTGLRLPSGPYDIPLALGDKVFDPSNGQLFFDLFNLDGILGDKYTINGKIQPFLEVKKRRYRFRIVNAGPSRVYDLSLSNGANFVQISNDGNLLPKAINRKVMRISAAERFDVVVDFTSVPAGSKVYLQNSLEQTNGRGPTGKALVPTVKMLEFRVAGGAVSDGSSVAAGKALLPLPILPAAMAATRRWEFGRQNGAWAVNGQLFDPDTPTAKVKQNTAEEWTFKSGGGWLHPVHVHFEEFQLQARDGKAPPIDEVARKDVVRIGSEALPGRSTGEARVRMQFRDFKGIYPIHCHNAVHEDHAMMALWEIVE